MHNPPISPNLLQHHCLSADQRHGHSVEPGLDLVLTGNPCTIAICTRGTFWLLSAVGFLRCRPWPTDGIAPHIPVSWNVRLSHHFFVASG